MWISQLRTPLVYERKKHTIVIVNCQAINISWATRIHGTHANTLLFMWWALQKALHSLISFCASFNQQGKKSSKIRTRLGRLVFKS
ncbi:hypothetical protein CsSME_00030966 [Camellia sinensis var. sinensis]